MWLVAAWVMLLILVACNSDGGQSLENTSWELTWLSDYEVPSDPTVTAEFGAEGDLTGFGGCNNYNTTYSVRGDEITISAPASTQMACVDSAMQLEQAYLNTLASAQKYDIQGNELVLRDGSDEATATFKEMQSAQ
jgi:heat shock protein HslJ